MLPLFLKYPSLSIFLINSRFFPCQISLNNLVKIFNSMLAMQFVHKLSHRWILNKIISSSFCNCFAIIWLESQKFPFSNRWITFYANFTQIHLFLTMILWKFILRIHFKLLNERLHLFECKLRHYRLFHSRSLIFHHYWRMLIITTYYIAN